jgi:hypothetical protein
VKNALLAFVTVLGLVVGVQSLPAGASPANFTGTWNTVYHCTGGWCKGQNFPSNGVVLVQAQGSSTVTNATGALVGTVSGRTLTMHGTDGSYTFTEVLTLAEDGKSYKGPDKDSNGTSGYVTAVRVATPDNSISGTVYRLVCTETECHHAPPLGPVTVVASSGSDTSSATTDGEGQFKIDALKSGTWRVAPSLEGTKVSLPRARTVTFGEVAADQSGVDFNVCDEHPAPNVPDGCSPIFDYTMPSRVADSALTKDYANPAKYTVTFTVRNGACDQSATYTWFVAGKQVADQPGAEPCQFKVDFDKLGTYSVRVDQQLNGTSNEKTSYIGKVVVQDFLVISVGDSLASGEGNPPYVHALGCDDSRTAYGAQAAAKLESADPRSSVTFLQLACSGAKIDADIAALPTALKALGSKGVFSGKASATLTRMGQEGTNSISNQLVRASELADGRHIDALTISIGINNLDFGSIVALCVVRVRCEDPPEKINILGEEVSVGSDLSKTVPSSISDLRSLMSDLHSVITELFPRSQLAPGDIYVVGYPDPLHDEAGGLCPVFIGSSDTSAFQNAHNEGEVTWAENSFIGPLERATEYFASGWNFVDAQGAFLTHGYCSKDNWFNQISDLLVRTNPSGILHPNNAGQSAIASLLEEPLLQHLLPNGKARPPS